jgi:SAM-dependent methyltransferase
MPRKRTIRDIAEKYAARRDDYFERDKTFHASDEAYLRLLIASGARVLDLGCGTGRLLGSLSPSYGVGVDISGAMISLAKARQPSLEFHIGDCENPDVLARLSGPFDYIVLSDIIGFLDDIQGTLEKLHDLCHPGTRVIITYYNYIWEPLLRLSEAIGLRMPTPEMNWLTSDDIRNFIEISGYEMVSRDWRQIAPFHVFGLGTLLNKYIGTLPLIRRFCLRHYLVARSTRAQRNKTPFVSVIVPARNEKGNIENIIRRIPAIGRDTEIIFVEGHSRDGTFEEIERVKNQYLDRDIKLIRQDGEGKGDAVRKGFDAAKGDVVMILDADMTVPPEDLPKFYAALINGGEFINGSRLVYPMERDAMRFLNRIANHVFSILFSWLLNQRFTDTLCGTKALWLSDYKRIAAQRAYFGNFDPFGDFDLIFGAAKLSLKVVEVPVRYAARVYGETQISRFRHGWLLLRMVWFAFFKFKAF